MSVPNSCSSHYLCAVIQVLTTRRGKSPGFHGILATAVQECSLTIGSPPQIGCNAVSWAPAVVPGSLIDQPSGQKPNYIKKFASGGCDNLIKLWRSVSCVDISWSTSALPAIAQPHSISSKVTFLPVSNSILFSVC